MLVMDTSRLSAAVDNHTYNIIPKFSISQIEFELTCDIQSDASGSSQRCLEC